jgi:hypothetical protein
MKTKIKVAVAKRQPWLKLDTSVVKTLPLRGALKGSRTSNLTCAPTSSPDITMEIILTNSG